MVVQTHAIVDPRAVVIKPLNAPLANTAVSRSISAHYFTVSAEKYRIENLHHLHEVRCFWFLKMARVLKHRRRVNYECEYEQSKLAVDQGLLVDVEWPYEEKKADLNEARANPLYHWRFQRLFH